MFFALHVVCCLGGHPFAISGWGSDLEDLPVFCFVTVPEQSFDHGQICFDNNPASTDTETANTGKWSLNRVSWTASLAVLL